MTGGGTGPALRDAAHPPAAGATGATRSAEPGWLGRLGLAVVHPRWALAIAGDRRNAGRSGSDLIAAIAMLLVATQLRGLASALWLGRTVGAGMGARLAMRVVSGALVVELGVLLIGALALFGLAGARRNLGRAFDLACVAVVPLVLVTLVALVVEHVLGLDAEPLPLTYVRSGLSYGWTGALIALAIRPARSLARVPAPPAAVVRPARWIGTGTAVLAAIGVAAQALWIAGHLELVKPMTSGDPAPELALPRIGPNGALGERVTLAASRGRVTVLDFWATWCGPCLAAMPGLEQLARSRPDVAVIAINIDDAAAARKLFDQRGYTMTLVEDDGEVSDRYRVSTIPHTVILDRRGVVREVLRGGGVDLGTVIDSIGAN